MGWLGLFASALAALGALAIAWADRNATLLSKRLAALIAVAALIALFDAYGAAREDANFQQALREQADKTLKLLTGGDGVSEVTLSFSDSGTVAALVIHNPNRYPLYDMSLTIVDIEAQRQDEANGTTRDFFDYTTIIPPLNVGPQQVFYHRNWRLSSSESVSYGISVTARNGSWFQGLRYRRIDGKWVRASRVTRGDNVILEQVDPGYPRDVSGGIAW